MGLTCYVSVSLQLSGDTDRHVAPQVMEDLALSSRCFLIVCWSILFFSAHPTIATPPPTILQLLSSSAPRHSQKMLVMSESRLKIQKTSGAEIRTKDQDTPLKD